MRFKNLILQTKKGIALVLCIGALPFVFSASVYAESSARTDSVESKNSLYFDDYSKPVGLTYDVRAVINANYLWRGMYCGGLNIQPSANVGYGGAYVEMWWNIGASDWKFQKFVPELDISIGFSRWGLNVYLLYIHNFNCGFFDFHNYHDRGNRLEIDMLYTLSSKIPLTFRWATRVSAADGYLDDAGQLKRAWSSYAELSYTQALPYDLSLYGAIGITPWRSCYTGYQRTFAVQNIELRLRKDWSLSEHCGMMIQGVLSINPSALAADKHTAEWHPSDPGAQSVNANIALGVYLK